MDEYVKILPLEQSNGIFPEYSTSQVFLFHTS